MTGWVPVREGVQDPPDWTPVGNIRGPAGPPGAEVLPYTMAGTLSVRSGTAPFPVSGGPFAVESIVAMVGAAPVGAAVIADVLVNGTSLFAPTDRPTIAPGTRTAVVGPHTDRTVTAGDYFTVDVLQVGSALAGADLTVVVRLRSVPG